MPTAGRLTGAMAFAALGAYIAYLTSPLFEEGTQPGYWWPLCIAAGVWAGWFLVGKRAGNGITSAIGQGITGVIAQVFWILFIFSAMIMLQKSMRRSYDGPVEAVVNVAEIAFAEAQTFYSLELVLTLLGGGIAASLFAEYFGKRFP